MIINKQTINTKDEDDINGDNFQSKSITTPFKYFCMWKWHILAVHFTIIERKKKAHQVVRSSTNSIWQYEKNETEKRF